MPSPSGFTNPPPPNLQLITLPQLNVDSFGNALSTHTVTSSNIETILSLLPDDVSSRLHFNELRHLWTLNVLNCAVIDLPLRIAGAPLLPVSWDSKQWTSPPRKSALEDCADVSNDVLVKLKDGYPDAMGFAFLMDGSVVILGDLPLNKESEHGKKKHSKERDRKGSEETLVTVDGFKVVRRIEMEISPLKPSVAPPSSPNQDAPVVRYPGSPIHMRAWRYVLGADLRQPLTGFETANIGVRVKEIASLEEYYIAPTHLLTNTNTRFKQEALAVQKAEAEEKKKRASLWEKIARRFRSEEVEKEELTAFQLEKIQTVYWGNGKSKDTGKVGIFTRYLDPSVRTMTPSFPADFSTDIGFIACSKESPQITYEHTLSFSKVNPARLSPHLNFKLVATRHPNQGWVLPIGQLYTRQSTGHYARTMLWRDVSSMRRDMTSGGPVAAVIDNPDGTQTWEILGFPTMFVGEDGMANRKKNRHEWAFLASFNLPIDVYDHFEVVNHGDTKSEISAAAAVLNSTVIPGKKQADTGMDGRPVGGEEFKPAPIEGGKETVLSKLQGQAGEAVDKTKTEAGKLAQEYSDQSAAYMQKGASKAADYMSTGAQKGADVAVDLAATGVASAGAYVQKGQEMVDMLKEDAEKKAKAALAEGEKKVEPALEYGVGSAREGLAVLGKEPARAKKEANEYMESGKATAGKVAEKAQAAVGMGQKKAEETKEKTTKTAQELKAQAETEGSKALETTKQKAAEAQQKGKDLKGEAQKKTEETAQAGIKKGEEVKSGAESKLNEGKQKAGEVAQAGMQRAESTKNKATGKGQELKGEAEKKTAEVSDAGKQKAQEMKDKSMTNAQNVKDTTQEKAEQFTEAGKQKATEAKSTAEQKAQDAEAKTSEAMQTGKDKTAEMKEQAKNLAADAMKEGQRRASQAEHKVEEKVEEGVEKGKATVEKGAQAAATLVEDTGKSFAQMAQEGEKKAQQEEQKAASELENVAEKGEKAAEGGIKKAEGAVEAFTSKSAIQAEKIRTGLASISSTSPGDTHPRPDIPDPAVNNPPLSTGTSTMRILSSRPHHELSDRAHQAVENMCVDDAVVETTPAVHRVKAAKRAIKKCENGEICMRGECDELGTCQGGTGASDQMELGEAERGIRTMEEKEKEMMVEEEAQRVKDAGAGAMIDVEAPASSLSADGNGKEKMVEEEAQRVEDAAAGAMLEDGNEEESPEAEGAASAAGAPKKKKNKKKGKGKKK